MKTKGMMVTALVFMVSLCSAEVVFEEDFESAEDYQNRWQAVSGWSLVESEINGRKTTVLDITGGNEGLSVPGGLGDFDYEADFRVVSQGAGFVFRAQDVDNLYMLWLAADDDSFYAHAKKKGVYQMKSGDMYAKLPLAHRIPIGQWQHVKFEIRGNQFKCFLGEGSDRMKLAGEWKGTEPYRGGRFGFRCVGHEHIQVDNIRITTPGPAGPELTVEPPALPWMITPGQTIEVKVNVRNTGWMTVKNLRANLSLPPGLTLLKGKPTQSHPSLKTTDRYEFSWKVKAERISTGQITIAAICDGLPVAEEISVDCEVIQAGSAEVVFEEDFESAEDYQNRWQAVSGWSLVESEINGRKTTVLDITGGNEGLSVQGGLGDFDYEADFRVVSRGAGFVFGAQDVDNLYTLWFPNDDDFFYPRTRKNGAYTVSFGGLFQYHDGRPPKQPLKTRISPGQWRQIKFKVRGNKFKCFLGDSSDRMELVGEWEGKESFQGGRFGFRCGFPHWDFGGEHMQVDNIRISTVRPAGPNLTVERSALPRMIVPGQSFELKANIQNTGLTTVENLQVTLSLPQGLELVKGRQTQSCPSLKTTARREFSWKVKAEEVTTGRMEITAICNDLPVSETISVDCVVNQALPVVSDKPAEQAAARIDANNNVILENQNLRMVFVKNTQGYTAAVIYVYDRNKWRQVAVSQPIGHIAYRTAGGQDVESDILPTSCEILDAGGPLAQVRFAAEKVDEDGTWWNFVYTFQVESGKDTVRTHYQAWANKDRQLLYFQGPDLYAGEGSFGARKHLSLFPGLEYLDSHERSSSDRDMILAYANRYAPHPYRVTIPLMAVEDDNCLVGVMWDTLQRWDGEHFSPSARFASPNFKDNQDNHLMGLFLPSIPEFVPENGDRAAKPYPLKANQKITLDAYIVADASAELLDILDHYLAVFGMPEKIALPITYDEALEEGRIGYMETLYDANAQGSKLWEGSEAYPAPGACSVLWRLSLDAKDPARKKMIRDRVDLMVNKALEREGVKGLTDWLDARHPNFSKYFPVSCGVRTHLLPFYIGHLEGGLAAWKTRVYEELIDKQRADGSWEYLGHEYECIKQGDEIVIGTITELTGGVLKYARITGDKRAMEAGLKALKYMERFTVPRGMNTWEVPKFTPDIQAAGLAVWCYLEAYQITGEQHYLERAKYWGKTGVPFVYLWKAPDRDIMPGSTIAVFGATWGWQNNWMGRPVQWCGLPYGYWILKLAQFDQSFPWRAIGQEILDSGIQQMLLRPAHSRGIYADNLLLVGTSSAGGPGFEPEMLMKSIFLLSGQGVEVDTKVLHQGGKRIHVSTGAILKSAELARRGRSVTFELEYPAGEISYAVVAGMSSKVKVEKDGRVLDQTDDLEAAGEGWKINADGLLLLKLEQDKPLVKIHVAQR